MPKETLIAIGAGVLSAISATAFLIQAPAALIFVYLASLPLFMAGLALGPRAVTVAGAITPVPGGVGPMTIACLLRNTVVAACAQNDIEVPDI